MPSAASDLALIEAAARDAGAIARAAFGQQFETWSKGDAGPVTEVDLAIDAMLAERLRAARPDYGWLSEETADTTDRLDHATVFIVDPIDGTRAFIAGEPQFCISIGIAHDGAAVLGAVYNPMLDEMFVGGTDIPATRNGAPIQASARAILPDSRLIGRPRFFENGPRWREPWPSLDLEWRLSIAYRLALIAAGAFDGAVMPGYKNEWDTVAGAAILEAAGGRVSDMTGAPLVFNQPDPRAPGCVAAGSDLHPLLIERVRHLPHPRDMPPAPPREIKPT